MTRVLTLRQREQIRLSADLDHACKMHGYEPMELRKFLGLSESTMRRRLSDPETFTAKELLVLKHKINYSIYGGE